MKPIGMIISMVVGLVMGAISSWSATSWVLDQTTLEVLKDPAIGIIIKVIVVVVFAPFLAAIMSWLYVFFNMIFDD